MLKESRLKQIDIKIKKKQERVGTQRDHLWLMPMCYAKGSPEGSQTEMQG